MCLATQCRIASQHIPSHRVQHRYTLPFDRHKHNVVVDAQCEHTTIHLLAPKHGLGGQIGGHNKTVDISTDQHTTIGCDADSIRRFYNQNDLAYKDLKKTIAP